MTKLVQLQPHERMTVKEALTQSLREAELNDLTDVVIIGYDSEGDLVIRNSHMTKGEANWLLDKAKMHALNIKDGTEPK